MNIIPAFPGSKSHNLAIEDWIQHVQGYARARDILGILFTEDQWITRPESGGVPYDIPVKPRRPPANASKTSIQHYNISNDEYKNHFRACNELRDAILHSIEGDPRSMSLIRDVGSISITTMVQRIQIEFSTWRPEDLSKIIIDLNAAWDHNNESIYELINRHEMIHAILERNQSAIGDMAKINHVMSALKASQLYEAWYQNWSISHSTVASRVYRHFINDIKTYSPIIHLKTSEMHFTANATTSVDEKPASKKQRKDRKMFCWCSTHFLNYTHWSNECRAPGSHHNKNEFKPPIGWTATA